MGTRITDAGLKQLEKTRLTYIKLAFSNNPHITDAGLRHLHQIKTLKQVFIHVSGTKVTNEGIRQLQAALPEANINLGKK